MKFKPKEKTGFLQGFIIGLNLFLIWLFKIFPTPEEKSTFHKADQLMMLFVFISNPVTFYPGYKNELKKGAGLENNHSEVQK